MKMLPMRKLFSLLLHLLVIVPSHGFSSHTPALRACSTSTGSTGNRQRPSASPIITRRIQRQPLLLFSTVKDDEITSTESSLPTDPDNAELVAPQDASEDDVSSNDNDDNPLSFFLQNTVFLGIAPTPDIVAIATIYFVEGALGLARLAQTFLLKDELHLGPAELSALTGLFVLPWTIKPLYGFLSDGFPLFGYKRRSYLVVAGLLGCASYTALGHDFGGLLAPEQMIPATVASLMISSGCIAFSDVVADGIVVQKTRDSDDPALAGGLQSLCWSSAAFGGLLSAYYSGSLLQVMKPQDVFQITAILPFLVACISLLIQEERQQQPKDDEIVVEMVNNEILTTNGSEDSLTTSTTTNGDLTISNGDSATALVATTDDDGVKGQIQALWDAIRQPSIWKPTLFLFLWQSTPTSDGAFLFFMTDELGFGPEFLGRVRLVTAGASLVGVWLYNRFLKTVPIKDILFWSSIVATPLGLSSLLLITHANRELGIPDAAFVFGDDVALAVLGEFAFLPTLVLAARLCPPGVEAVLFATLMSIYNGAGTVGTEVGALLTKALGVTESNFDNLGLLTIICNLSSLYPLFFIGWLDEVGAASEQEEEASQLQQALPDDDDSTTKV
ncbi:biopterin transporter 1, chloroplastic [Seminavis robusta]|uniref:Biopterin transporter 1, chloroplastic n=1 Tax=Seminavis robusta TaxID=568900 RepID=A0A9N8ERW0_9STRA|nr:biopterin transporter 1, chloroplastic [Seminavis robusta]|eukprot:Sro1704_g292350.1 biopterin transporter 1, chloroplastic (616) ;mRNA; f:2263-4110